MGREGVVFETQSLSVAFRLKSRKGWRRRERRWALKDVTLQAGAGEMLGVIGGNGSGKTTLLQCAVGIIRPDQGSVAVAGRAVSLVDLSAGFNRELTGRENIVLSGVLCGLSRRDVQARMEAIAGFAGLDEAVLDTPLRTYSTGMVLRIGFSVVVNSDPSLLLIDEVLAVGDESFQRRCLAKIDELRASGCAAILVTHDLDLVLDADRVAVLNDGIVRFDGAPSEAVAAYRALSGGDPDEQDMSEDALYGIRPGRRRRGRR